MRPKAGQPRSGCAINAAVEVIGDRWSLFVLLAELGRWGAYHRPTTPTPTLRVRAALLADGGPAMWEDFMTRNCEPSTSGCTCRRDLDQLRPSALPRPTLQHSLPTQTT